ncbi:MAG: histidine kinase [Saprospiraceae bacterium]|nr:histidine kinase [Saprospiraceae bacterium]
MDTAVKQDWRFRLVRFLSSRWAYHVLFWLVLLILFTLIEETQRGFFFTLSNEIINVLFYAIIVYFNLFYLIPNYLSKNRFLTYAALLILSAIIITPLKMIVLYFKFTGYPGLQTQLVANQGIYFILTFVIAIFSTLSKIISDWVRTTRERQELETRTMQTELRFLKSQINPHFLFNTLNSLYALTLKKSEKAPEIVIKLSEMMRYMLYECNEKRVPLSNEVHYIRNYLDLERLRHGDKVDIRFEVTGHISDQQIAPLMFIPFIENSFKHGLTNQISKGFVDIKLMVDGQQFDFYIENSKPDALPVQEHHRRSGGIGLVNVRRRLDILYPKNYELTIHDNPKSYAVNLHINMNA